MVRTNTLIDAATLVSLQTQVNAFFATLLNHVVEEFTYEVVDEDSTGGQVFRVLIQVESTGVAQSGPYLLQTFTGSNAVRSMAAFSTYVGANPSLFVSQPFHVPILGGRRRTRYNPIVAISCTDQTNGIANWVIGGGGGSGSGFTGTYAGVVTFTNGTSAPSPLVGALVIGSGVSGTSVAIGGGNVRVGNQLEVSSLTALDGNVTMGGVNALTINQSATSNGVNGVLTAIGASHSLLTSSTENPDVNFNLARTVNFNTGALSVQRAFIIQAPTYSFQAASTLTQAATFAITGAPITGANATITSSYALWVQSGRTQLDGVTRVNGSSPDGSPNLWVIQGANAVASGNRAFMVSGGAHTALTASSELIDIYFNLFRTVQFATGSITQQRAVVIEKPTYSFVGASTLTTAATFAINGAPAAGANATITNAYALWVQVGKSEFDDIVQIAPPGGSGINGTTLAVLQGAAGAGTPIALQITGGAHVGLTGGTEVNDVNINLNRIVTWPSGPITTQRAVLVSAPTYKFNVANTITTAATFAITGAPVAGSGMTITSSYALWVQSGRTQLDGVTRVNGSSPDGSPNLWVIQGANAIAAGNRAFMVSGGAHTALTASSEVNDVYFLLGRIVQFSTGPLTTQRAVVVEAPTYAFVAASTITSAATFAITGAPITGVNATLTASYALWVQGGLAQFDGSLTTVGTGTFGNLALPRTGSGATNGTYWSLGLTTANNGDSFLIAWTSSAYLTGGGITGWTNDNPNIYVPTGHALRIANGTGAANYLDLSATALTLVGADIICATLGKGLQIKEGANGRSGNATLVGGTVTVACTNISSTNSRIQITKKTLGGTVGNHSYTISNGVSFTINSSSGTDTSVVTYLVTEAN